MKPASFSLFVLHATILVATVSGLVEPWNDEQRLVSDLWAADRYDAWTRPVRDVSQPVRVTMVADVFAVLRLDSKNQQFAVGSAFNMQWQDDRLRWNPANYSDLEFVTVPVKTVWYPPILVLNAIEETWLITDETYVVVSSEGKLHVGISLIHVTQCHLDETRFPFDNQTCEVIIGARNVPYTVVSIEGTAETTPRERIIAVHNWIMDGITVTNATNPSCITEQNTAGRPCLRTAEALLFVRLTREPTYYLYTVFGPCTVLVIIASTIFWLPPECGEKLSYGIAILFGFVIFQLVLQDTLVESGRGEPPILTRYVLWSFLLVGAAMLATVVTISLHHRGDAHGPKSEPPASSTTNQNNVHQTAVDEMPLTPISFSSSEEQIPRTGHQSKKQTRRNWKKIAKRLDGIFFVLYYIAYAIYLLFIILEINLLV